MTETEVKERIAWSTTKVVEWVCSERKVCESVHLMRQDEVADEDVRDFVTQQASRNDWLMTHVFEPITGVRFEDIDWTTVLSEIDDMTESAE